MKYRIRQVSMKYSKEKARLRKVKIFEIEKSLTVYQEKCAADPSTENFEQLEILKSKYDAHFDYLSKGAIIRSRASWYEKGEKNTKYFLSLESHKKAKSCVRKVFTKNGTLSSDPKIIMNELEDFYTGLYDSEDLVPDCANLFLRHPEFPKLSPEKAATCEGKLTVEECLHSLQSFKENKSSGNDGLTVEFFKTFWGILGKLLVESLNCAFDHGELSNSQKQAIITLIEKRKEKTGGKFQIGNKNIQGILVGKEEIKLEMFADDVTAFLRNTRSLEALLHTADLFSKCSGLEINSEKTECMVLGNHVSSTVATVTSSKNMRVKHTIKFVGVYCV